MQNREIFLDLEKRIDLGNVKQVQKYTDLISETRIEEQMKILYQLMLIMINESRNAKKDSAMIQYLCYYIKFVDKFFDNESYEEQKIINGIDYRKEIANFDENVFIGSILDQNIDQRTISKKIVMQTLKMNNNLKEKLDKAEKEINNLKKSLEIAESNENKLTKQITDLQNENTHLSLELCELSNKSSNLLEAYKKQKFAKNKSNAINGDIFHEILLIEQELNRVLT